MSYQVDITEVAEMEIDAAYLWYSERSPEGALRWYGGLLRSIRSLSEMPRRCPLAPEHERYDVEVRQLLYGRGQNVYRILYRIVEPEDEEEGVVRILHVYHGARQRADIEKHNEDIS